MQCGRRTGKNRHPEYQEGLSEDAAKDAETDMQEKTNNFITIIEKHLTAKDKEIMSV